MTPPASPHPRISTAIVGAEAGPLTQRIDARWVMAYAAALDENDRYFDTAAPAGPLVHPLFAVCYEWPVAVELRAKSIDPALAPFAVHARHRLRIYRAPRVGDTLLTTARVVSVERRFSGTLVVMRFATVDERGHPVTTTEYGSVYRGVDTDAEARAVPMAGAASSSVEPKIGWEEAIEIPPHAPHVYSECARIWNPIHTDLAAARAAGLPGLILHGTATLALAVSRVVAREGGGDPTRVREIGARFTGIVEVPSRLVVHGYVCHDDVVAFDVISATGRPVLNQGLVRL